MAITTISDKKLRSFIRESIKEVLEAEFMKLRALMLPNVSDREQKDIEKRYGRPSRKKVKTLSVNV
jgi:hypothetical protein